MPAQQSPILVALQNDPRDQKIIATAANLAKALGEAPVHFIHSIDDPMLHPSISVFEPEIIDILQKNHDIQNETADSYLQSVVKSFEGKASYSLHYGIAADVILEEAQNRQAAFILAGAKSGSHWLPFTGLSVTRKLMANSSAPVMVINDNTELNLHNQPPYLRILCCDDFSEAGLSIYKFLRNHLSPLAQACEVTALHVHPLTEIALEAGIQQALLTSHSSAAADIDIKTVLTKVNQSLTAKFRERAGDIPDTWKLKVRHGVVSEQLSAEINAFKPDLVVFGQHRLVHTSPFYLGTVPFSTAYKLNLPFVVAP